MKTIFFALALGLAAGAPSIAAPAQHRITVAFDHPEIFTDFKDSAMPTTRGRDAILQQIRKYLHEQAREFIPAGDHLSITFTDIKLAGQFEPWRGPDFDNVRIIRDIYPPFFRFHYVFTNASGKVIAHGDKDLTDLAFQDRLTFPLDDPLRYEKAILSDWMQSMRDKALG